MSLLSTPQMFLASILSRFPPRIQILDTWFCIFHTQPFALQRNQLCYLGFFLVIASKMMNVNNKRGIQLNILDNLPSSFLSHQLLPHEYARIFHHIENIPLQHNQTHPFLNFTHKNPHNSTLKPTTLFIYVPLCPNLIFAIISLKLLTIFRKISFLSLTFFLPVFVYAIFQTLSKPFQAPCD